MRHGVVVDRWQRYGRKKEWREGESYKYISAGFFISLRQTVMFA